MKNHPTYPYLVWVQAIASDTHIDANTTGYVSPGLIPLVVTRETDESWVGFEVENRYERSRESHWMKSIFRRVEEKI